MDAAEVEDCFGPDLLEIAGVRFLDLASGLDVAEIPDAVDLFMLGEIETT